MSPSHREINFDGLPSPLHNYAGLSKGNLASQQHADATSHPRQAALQGLEKMLLLAERGLPQAFIPPQRRPALHILRQLGFHGSDAQVITAAHRTEPTLLAATSSSSAMWTANAATYAPSLDTSDQKSHLVPANLASNFHRSIEPPLTTALLKQLLPGITQHQALPTAPLFHDEGAANHTRLAPHHHAPGIHLFAYGHNPQDPSAPKPTKFPARQTLPASQALARLLHLPPERTLFLQQSTTAIDAGVFHNDVISTGNQNLLLTHQHAFQENTQALSQIQHTYEKHTSSPLHIITVPDELISLADAVKTYLFNSQILTLPDGTMLLLAPLECQQSPPVKDYIHQHLLPGAHPLNEVHYMDLRQSMHNGGGPACLRLRLTLSTTQLQEIPPTLIINSENHQILTTWVQKHYPEDLHPSELGNPDLHQNAQKAFDELEHLLKIKIP